MRKEPLSPSERTKQLFAVAMASAAAYLGCATVAEAADPTPPRKNGKVHVVHGDTAVVSMRGGKPIFYEQDRIFIDRQEITFDPNDSKQMELKQDLVDENGKQVEVWYGKKGPDTVVVPIFPTLANDTRLTHEKFGYSECRFADSEPMPLQAPASRPGYDKDYWNAQLGDGTVDNAKWFPPVQLTQNTAEFVNAATATPDLYKIAQACVTALEKKSDVSEITNFQWYLPRSVSSTSWGGRMNLTIGGVSKDVGLAWLPAYDFVLSTAMGEHELAHQHTFGHSADKYGKNYGNPFSVTGDVFFQCAVASVCMPQNISNAEKRMLGVANEVAVLPGYSVTKTLQANDEIAAVLPNGIYLIVEKRTGTGYDSKITSGVVAYTVNPTRPFKVWNELDTPLQPMKSWQFQNISVCANVDGSVTVINDRSTDVCTFGLDHKSYLPIIGLNS